MEQLLTLRKLESLTTASASTLELIRQQMSQDHGEPWVSVVYELYSQPCRRLSSNDGVFAVHITLNNAQKEPSDLADWNQWIYRDMYMKLLFRADRDTFQVHVDCFDFSENSRKNKLALKALNAISQNQADFQMVRHEKCKNCCDNSTSHLNADFELKRENLAAGFFPKDGKLKLSLCFS